MLPTEKCVKEINLHTLPQEAKIMVIGYFYDVDLGYGVRPQHHRISKDLICTCGLGADCPAVRAVAAYLKDGGERAQEPPAGFFPVVPQTCPVCGAETFFVPELSSRRRGAGWLCRKVIIGSTTSMSCVCCLLQTPGSFHPCMTLDGRLLYPGVRRDDVITEDTLVRE